MSDKNMFDDVLAILEEQDNRCPTELSEIDFYPPSDNRVLESYIEDVDGGDNFADYCEYIFELYEEEGYYD